MRKTVFKWHSVSALLALIPLMLIAVTGSILVFKVEIDNLLMPQNMLVEANQNTQRKSLDVLIKTVDSSFPQHLLGTWELFDNKERSDAAYLIEKSSGEWFKVYLNQYTGEVLSQPVTLTSDITDWLVSLHYTFLLGFSGTVLGFVFAVILLFLAISGIILHRQFWKKLFTLRFSAARRVLYSDVHKFIGIQSSPVLLVLAITGGYWNAAEALHELEEHIDTEHVIFQQNQFSENLSFQKMLNETPKHIGGFEATYFSFPYEENKHITFYGEVPIGNPLISQYASVITFDRNTGQKLSQYDIRQAATFNVVLDTFRRLHFGNFAGLTSKIIWCVLGLSPLWLAITGLYFYLSRTRKRKPVGTNVHLKAETPSHYY